MKSTRIKESKALQLRNVDSTPARFSGAGAVRRRRNVDLSLSLPLSASIACSLSLSLLVSGSRSLPLSPSQPPFSLLTARAPQLTSGLPCDEGGKGPTLSLRTLKALTKRRTLISARRNCYQMQFEYLVSLSLSLPLSLQWRLWTAARRGVSGSLVET